MGYQPIIHLRPAEEPRKSTQWDYVTPWRFSQDSVTGEIWAGDVGRADWEEIDKIIPGSNYGWPIMEGSHCRTPGCDSTGFIDPVYDYSHDDGCAVIGGRVYRGSAIPSLFGKFIFSDVCTGEVSSLEETDQGPIVESLTVSGLGILTFGETPDGELYLTAAQRPRLMQLIPDPNAGSPPRWKLPNAPVRYRVF